MSEPTLADVEHLARQAGLILSDGYEKDHQVNYKGIVDPVTEVDHASEKFLIDEISRLFPGHSFLAEESGASITQTEHLWIIDPLDGTVNYAHSLPMFCVSIAYSFRGQVLIGAVFDPMRDELFSAERGVGSWLNGHPIKVTNVDQLEKSLMATGFPYDSWFAIPSNFEYFERLGRLTQGVRRLGSAAIDLCYVAAGRLDGFWEITTKAWDIAAAGLIAEQAGAKVTNIKGEDDYLKSPQSLVAANPSLHPKLLEQLR